MIKKIAFVIIAIIMFIWFLSQLGYFKPKTFNHNKCMYPVRTTNPPNGCDNSDPANPYCAVKGLPEDCSENNNR